MPATPRRRFARLALPLLLSLGLGACSNVERLGRVGQDPDLSAVESPAPIARSGPVEMPMPKAVSPERQANSLWRPGSRAFFKDQRASRVGDILTVVIVIDDSASLSNSSQRSRDAAEDMGVPSFLGFESQLGGFLPDEIAPDSLVSATSTSNSQGTGAVQRNEEINLRIAATVTQLLPNGNLVIAGRQETRVNAELRELQVAGIIRPEDITATNTINYDQIAEARVAYGGRGFVSDVQRPRYGQELYDILWPF